MHGFGKLTSITAAILCAAAVWTTTTAAEAKTSWTLVYKEPNTGNSVIDVDALDATHAWAVGVKSENGNSKPFAVGTSDGATWDALGLPSGYLIALYSSIAFSDPQNGWLGGMTGKGGRVWKTTDGGASWAEAAVLDSNNIVEQVQAFPTGEMFAAATSMMVVYDGKEMQNVAMTLPSGFGLAAVRMLNPSCGYAMAKGDSPGAVLYWTADGGKTWQQRGEQLGYTLSKMSWVDKNTGWAVGAQAGAGVVARTTDGGATWTVANVPEHPAAGMAPASPATDCSDVKFFDKSRGVAVCQACTGGCDDSGGDPSYLTIFVRTEDGGASWTMDPDYEAKMVAPPFGAMAKFSGMFSLSFPDPNNGYIAGTNNLILRYVADSPEPAGLGQPTCESGGGGNGSGGSGSGGNGSGASAAAPSSDSDSGCGCHAAAAGTAGLWIASALTMLSVARLRRRPKRN